MAKTEQQNIQQYGPRSMPVQKRHYTVSFATPPTTLLTIVFILYRYIHYGLCKFNKVQMQNFMHASKSPHKFYGHSSGGSFENVSE